MARERWHHKKGTLVRESDAAYLVSLDDMDEDVWLPKSQVDREGSDTFVVPEWLCEKKDIPFS